MFEAELEYERLLRKQELLKREKEHKKELQSVREELETEKQKLPNVQEVQLSHTPTYHICMGTLALPHDIQEQIIENDSQSLETLSLQAFSNVSTWHIATCLLQQLQVADGYIIGGPCIDEEPQGIFPRFLSSAYISHYQWETCSNWPQ